MSVDIAIVGGGIVGTGIARDAALRGLSVALFEKEDFGAGTTSRSTRLVHGGLRYLKNLELGLVREGLRERRALLRNASHLVRRLPFLMPVYRGRGHPLPWLWSGIALYDLLSVPRDVPHHRFFAPEECRRLEPSLRPEGLVGAFLFYDAQCDFPERLCVENVLDAAFHGASVRNHARVVDFVRRDGRVAGVRVRDEFSGSEEEVEARLVVNASGPWVDDILGQGKVNGPKRLRRTKGIHLVVPRFNRHALIMETEDRKRVFFAIPWRDYTLLGTTDTDYTGLNEEAKAEPADIDYLLGEIERVLDLAIDRRDILFTTAGLRALPYSRETEAGDITRRHRLLDHVSDGAPGLWTIVGGKITTFRSIAEEVVDRFARTSGAAVPRSSTRHLPLPGAFVDPESERRNLFLVAESIAVEPETAVHLVDVYGSRALEILQRIGKDPRLKERLLPGRPEVVAEVDHAVEKEFAKTAEDVLLRRTGLGLAEGSGIGGLPAVVQRMGQLLEWGPDRRAANSSAYRRTAGRMSALGAAEGEAKE